MRTNGAAGHHEAAHGGGNTPAQHHAMAESDRASQGERAGKPAAAPLRTMGLPVSMRSGRAPPGDSAESSPSARSGPLHPPAGPPADPPAESHFLGVPASLQGKQQSSVPSSPPPAAKFTPPRHVSDSVSTGSLENVVLSESDATPPPRPPVIVTSAAAVNPPPSPYSDASGDAEHEEKTRNCCCASVPQCLFQCLSLAAVVLLATSTGLAAQAEPLAALSLDSEAAGSAMAKLVSTFGATVVVLALGFVAVCLSWPIMAYCYVFLLGLLLVAYLFVARECRDALFYSYGAIMGAWPSLSDTTRAAIEQAGQCCGRRTPLDMPSAGCLADAGAQVAGCRYALGEVMARASDAMAYAYAGALLLFVVLAVLAIVATRRPRATAV